MNLEQRASDANEVADQKLSIPEQVITSLSGHIDYCFSEAESAKTTITDKLLACERQRKGEYEPRLKAQIEAMGAQPIYMMLTDIKCRAADSWIKDVMQNHNEATWALTPTEEPDLPPQITQEIISLVMQEAAMVAQMGQVVEADAIEARKAQVAEEAAIRAKEIAVDRAKKMENRIIDKLQEGGWRESLGHAIYDFTTFPAAFFKGPVLRKKPKMKWGPNFQPIVEDAVVLEVERVSPYDIFPSPAAVTIQDGYLIHRQKLTRTSLHGMVGMRGVDKEAIEGLLRQFPTGYRMSRNGDSARDALNNRLNNWSADGTFDALEYWGPASGIMLKEWGMVMVDNEPVDDFKEYQINAWKVADVVIRVVLNPHPLNQRPYSKACFVEVPGSFWGKSLPEMMEDVQTMCNASARALAMNMGIASGPQVEVSVDRMAQGAKVTNIVPWKIWQTTMDRTGGGQPAIRFHQPDMHAQELLAIFTHFSRMADEVTGVPNYIYGSTAVGGAGRTASGLSMLMENAAKGIKHAILSLDAASSQMINRFYLHLMIHDPDTSIKGDMNIVAAGAIGAMIREQQEISRQEFMDKTANPIDMQIIGMNGRAHMLREHAKTLFPDVDKIVPDPTKLMAMQAMQQAAAAPQLAQQQNMAQQAPGGALPPTQTPLDPNAAQTQQQLSQLPSPQAALNGR